MIANESVPGLIYISFMTCLQSFCCSFLLCCQHFVHILGSFSSVTHCQNNGCSTSHDVTACKYGAYA